MKQLCFLSLFFVISLTVYAQHQVKGNIINESGEDVGFCHVYNQTLGTGKVADMQGRFQVTARKDDTIRFSYVGYATLELVIESIHLANYIKITLPEDSIMLPSIRIYADKYYKVPLNIQGEPIFIPGVSIVDAGEPIEAGDIHPGTNPGVGGIPGGGLTIEGPITYFSKDEREKRKAQEAYEETQKTITYQKYIAQDTVREKLCELYKINDQQYDEIIVRLHQFWPDIQKSYRPTEIWNWLLVHFDRTVPVIREQMFLEKRD